MKKMTRILCLLLSAVLLTLSLAACADKEPKDPGAAPGLTDEQLYDEILGDFYEAYQAALAVSNVSERYALMAIAEAKMLEAGVMLPMQANGGNYAISKVVPYTATSVLWGNDSYRYHNMVLATELIKASDRDALKALYAEKKGTGGWESAAKEYLTSHGYTLQNTYTYGYTSDPSIFDVHQTSKAVDSEALVNTYDGLIEYNSENTLSPALATEWSVSDDGLTWTFKIREGAIWVDSHGEEVADVTANDFVAGFQHMLDDPNGGLSWLVDGVIVGVSEYLSAKSDDFSGVGVKAIDDHTLQYTLTDKCSYFDTMFGYGVFAPLCSEYYQSLGGKFGFGAESGTYGTSYETIAYCGPYLITNHTEKQVIEFTKNANYWNADNINLEKITWRYAPADDSTWAFTSFNEGLIDGCGLNTANRTKAVEVKGQEWFDTYAYVSGTDATSFPAFFNVNRNAFNDTLKETELVSAKTDAQKETGKAAMLNQNFRLALALSFDRGQYMATRVGDELKYTSMVNSYTPGTFVSLLEDVTVKINGTDKTYKAGTFYGQIMQDQIDADGYPMKVFDSTADGGLGSSGGYDGWYNLDKAKEYFAKAVEDLKAQGIEVTKENPIVIDYTNFNDGAFYSALSAVVKQSIEKVSDGLLVVNILETQDEDAWYNSLYDFMLGSEANYDINTLSGWGPDYGDPSTYLDTMIIGGGYMVKCLGLDC